MSRESLQVQVRLMQNITGAALDLAENGADNSSEDNLFFIKEDLGLLKVLEGENSSAYKSIDRMMGALESRASNIKENASKHI